MGASTHMVLGVELRSTAWLASTRLTTAASSPLCLTAGTACIPACASLPGASNHHLQQLTAAQSLHSSTCRRLRRRFSPPATLLPYPPGDAGIFELCHGTTLPGVAFVTYGAFWIGTALNATLVGHSGGGGDLHDCASCFNLHSALLTCPARSPGLLFLSPRPLASPIYPPTLLRKVAAGVYPPLPPHGEQMELALFGILTFFFYVGSLTLNLCLQVPVRWGQPGLCCCLPFTARSWTYRIKLYERVRNPVCSFRSSPAQALFLLLSCVFFLLAGSVYNPASGKVCRHGGHKGAATLA